MFRIELTECSAPSVQSSDDEPIEYDDALGALIEICRRLERFGVQFEVEGFGQRWPVSVAYDLPGVLEQLPGVVEAVRNLRSCSLEIYEQGVQRTLEMLPVRDSVEIRCVSQTAWVPDPAVERLSSVALLAQLRALAFTAARLAESTAEDVVGTTSYRAWSSRVRAV